jgi:hypothetical protein
MLITAPVQILSLKTVEEVIYITLNNTAFILYLVDTVIVCDLLFQPY